MARITRPPSVRPPLRPAKWYPYGTTIEMRRGTFIVAPTQVHVTDADFDLDYLKLVKSWYELPGGIAPEVFLEHIRSQVSPDALG